MLLQHRWACGVMLCVAGAAPSVHAQMGACCSGASCFVTTAAGCEGAFPEGAYQGDGSSCPGLCLQDGACCFADGACAFLHFGPCNVGDGTFQGDSTTCIPNLCPPPAPVPTQINHQGVVSVNGQRFTGDGDFYFAIIDPVTGNSVWTNDATNIGTANRPNQPVTIACANGLYDVRLGDLLYLNMKPIPVSVFSSENRTLRIWFDDDDEMNGIFQMTPDHALTSVPYAFRAAEVGSVVPITRVNTSSGTWSKPAGLKYVVVEVQAGGGGGGGNTTAYAGAGGGGGGGYSKTTVVTASLGAIETVTVGAAGSAGAASGAAGEAGGTSSFGALLSATGGAGGASGQSGNAADGGAGGVGIGGDLNIAGSGGGQGSGANGGSAASISIGGNGGATVLGCGAGITAASGTDGEGGLVGAAYGGGGGGASNANNNNDIAGGAGGAGVVIVTEYY